MPSVESAAGRNKPPSSGGPQLRPNPNQPRLDIPPASSIYSQDISPPDSPRTGDGARSSSPNVSPVTDGGSISRGHGTTSRIPATSNIPLPTPRSVGETNAAGSAVGGTAAYIAGWRDKIATGQASGKTASRRTKWDKYSGEPTDSEKGKPGQTSPGSTAFERQNMGLSTTVTGGQGGAKPNLFAQTLRKVGKKDGSPTPREEWKGASGREAIVAPIPENAQARKLPTPSQRRKQQGLRTVFGGRNSPAKDTAGKASPAQDPSPPMQEAKSPMLAEEETPEVSSPVEDVESFPTIEEQSYPQRFDSYGKPDASVHHSTPIPLPRKETFQGTDETSATKHHVNPDSAAGSTIREVRSNTATTPNRDTNVASVFEHLNFHNEPGSRFSSTTYATTIPDSPPQTPETQPEMPHSQPLASTPSILNRKRPIPASATTYSIRATSRKPTPSQIIEQEKKPVPAPPEHVEPVDKVTLLEAKLSSLHKRRANISTVIEELTNVAQPSSVAYDIASRSEIKKTVSGLTTEQAQIAKEIHDTGLQLHRALKKRDGDAPYEPTGLWVRRVTE